MRKWLGFILLLGLLAFPSIAGAQNEIQFDSLKVELWSEYDQPSMLVISEFVLSKDIPVPATVTMRIPKEANLMAVAVNQGGNLFNANFEGPDEQGNWLTIRVDVQSYDPYRIEYYQPLERDGQVRRFEYQWFGDYAVQDIAINLLVPSDSTDLVTSPTVSNTTVNGGFIVGSTAKSGLNAGEPFKFDLEYARQSDTVANPESSTAVQPSEPIGADTEGRVAIDQMPYVIGGVGVVLIVIALFFYWRSTQSNISASPRRRRRQKDESSEEQAYCHECGTRAQAGDRFCRTCGSRLRMGS